VAAIDCGTNSLRLLVADIGADGTLTEVDRRTQIVRLGQGVDRTGVLASDALERTFAVTREYARIVKDCGVDAVRFVATSATRDAHNRDDFFAGIRSAIGVDAEVISGDEEASLSFRGATGPLQGFYPGPFLVVDLGGGSTELVLGAQAPIAAVSMNIGSVRITERYLHCNPPTPEEVAAARADVRAALAAASSPASAVDEHAATVSHRRSAQRLLDDRSAQRSVDDRSAQRLLDDRSAQRLVDDRSAQRLVTDVATGMVLGDGVVPQSPGRTAAAGGLLRGPAGTRTMGPVPLGLTATLVGLAGSITSITAFALGLTSYDRSRVGGAVLTVEETIAASERMLAMSRDERLALGFLPPMRADVIGAGALIWSEVVARVRDDVAAAGGSLHAVVTSEHDILDGIALGMAR
jgi:exopolyphosphatase/guanosine-5'-triphosphate,3'-diphosphate pyrophosphatase